MDLQDFRIFARVAAVQNLSAVGHELGLTPGTISKRLQALEDDLKVRLFDRTTRSIRITAEGKTFLTHVERILLDIESARSAIGNFAAHPRGALRICAPNALGRHEMAPAISQFMHRYPEIDVSIDLSNRNVSLLEDGYDVILRVGALTDSTLIAKRLGTLNEVLTAAPSYLKQHGAPVVPADLVDHSCLILGELNQWVLSVPHAKSRDREAVPVRGRIRTNSAAIAHRAALDGHGILCCCAQWVHSDIADGRLVPVLPEFTVKNEAAVYAIYAGNRHLAPRLRVLLDFLTEWFRKRKSQQALEPFHRV